MNIQPAAASTLYVAPSGNDKWSGRLAKANRARTDGPLASLIGARDAIRRLRSEGMASGPVLVLVADGIYSFAQPLIFAPKDSGTKKCPVIYEAARGAHPVFVGARRITGFQPGKDGIWTVDVPGVRSGRWYFEQLYVNGRRATRARSPNKSYYYMGVGVRYETDPATNRHVFSRRAFNSSSHRRL